MYMVSYNDNWSVNKWCSSIQPIPDIQTSPEIRRYMITYEVMQRIEGDTEKHSNYELIQYEFPFPENSVLIERDKEMNRILNKPIIITTSNNNNCQQ